jgi:phosphatidylserine decarboxylase
LVMVAAFGVGNIETPYDPGFGKGRFTRRERDFETPPVLVKGDEIGAFLLGSTVVMVWSEGAVELVKDLEPGPVAMGRLIGSVRSAAQSGP